jgi:hypothetical protein
MASQKKPSTMEGGTLHSEDAVAEEGEDAEGYTEGIAYVLGNGDNWFFKSKEEQLALRSQRARAGVKCEGCGAVGYFRRTCPKCGPGVQREIDARKRPTALPAFKKIYSRDFGLWARYR